MRIAALQMHAIAGDNVANLGRIASAGSAAQTPTHLPAPTKHSRISGGQAARLSRGLHQPWADDNLPASS